jgi:hypothetical protein
LRPKHVAINWAKRHRRPMKHNAPDWKPGDPIPPEWTTRRASGLTYFEWLRLTNRWPTDPTREERRRVMEGID